MIRYRPPGPPKSPYITKDGFNALQTEEKSLWRKRREIVNALSEAAAEGDRSENAEYIYRKKELRELDWRIRYLQKRLPELIIVEQKPANLTQVFFSATICIEDDNGIETTYRIVGPDEIDHKTHYISIDSPVAKTLLKKYLGDKINVATPEGNRSLIINSISYID